MKKLLVCIFGFLFAALDVRAANYTIEQFDVFIYVDKNKVAYITETIDVDFTALSHGIYRIIPLKGGMVSDVEVSETYQTHHTDNNINIKIGNPDDYVAGPHRYVIQYKYTYYDRKPEFYHNIIGSEWSADIKKAAFVVELPAEVEASQVGLSIGQAGTAGFDGDAVFQVKGNRIFGQTLRPLAPYEGITLRVEVPADFFIQSGRDMKQITIAGMIFLMLAAFLTWYLYGKDEPEIPVVNFYPPEKLNAAEIELAFKGKASTKGVVALLIELAQKGYIKIDSQAGSMIISKLKNATGLDRNQTTLMTALFPSGNDKVTLGQLETSRTFYRDCQDIIKNVNAKRYKIFHASSIGFPLQALMFTCLIGLLLLIGLCIFDFQIALMRHEFLLLLCPAIAAAILTCAMKRPMQLLRLIFWAIGFGGIPLLELATEYSAADNIPYVGFGIGCMIVAGICTYQLPKRNPRGQKYLNHLLGLKHFIEVAEKPRLQQLVEQDPQYFYNVLPSAYVLGVSDKWIKQFERIMLITPEWFDNHRLSVGSLNGFARNISKAAVPSIANGGITKSSGRGGFVGGGGGGGGGGSW